MHGVEIADYGDAGYGLKTTEDLKQGQEVICVPQAAMLTEETARKSYLGNFFLKFLCSFFWVIL